MDPPNAAYPPSSGFRTSEDLDRARIDDYPQLSQDRLAKIGVAYRACAFGVLVVALHGADRRDAGGGRHRPDHTIWRGQLADFRDGGDLRDDRGFRAGRDNDHIHHGWFRRSGSVLGRNRQVDRDRRCGRGLILAVVGRGAVIRQHGAGVAVVPAAGGERVGAVCHRDRPFLRALVHRVAKPGAQLWAACSGGAMRTNSWPCSPHQPLAGP